MTASSTDGPPVTGDLAALASFVARMLDDVTLDSERADFEGRER